MRILHILHCSLLSYHNQTSLIIFLFTVQECECNYIYFHLIYLKCNLLMLWGITAFKKSPGYSLLHYSDCSFLFALSQMLKHKKFLFAWNAISLFKSCWLVVAHSFCIILLFFTRFSSTVILLVCVWTTSSSSLASINFHCIGLTGMVNLLSSSS